MKASTLLMPDYGDGADLSARGAGADARHDRLSALLEGAAEGDGAALASLYDETSPFIFGLLTRMLGAGAAAEEALVEVYSCVLRGADSYRSGGVSPLAWLVSTARECALRKDRPRPAVGRPRETPERLEAASASAGGAERVPPAVESARAREALRGLHPKQRRALELSYFSGTGRVEAALGLTAGEARSLVSDAVRSYCEIFKGAAAGES